MNESTDIFAKSALDALPVILPVTLVFTLLAFFLPRRLQKLLRAVERVFSRFAQRETLSILVLFFSVIAIRLAVIHELPVPVPGIHDEYSYLLLADTLAHGRLANPTHPMWISFETFHVNWFPTYSSKYPPAQGAVLALGQLLGHPWIGVLLSDALMCAVILWMLQAWLPARWAFLGGILVALKFGVASYWMNSYWGGAVAATGGALVLGALPRLVRRVRLRDSLLLGLGIAILANTRPYEGLLFCIPAAIWFFWWLAGKTKPALPARDRFSRGFLPAAAVLAFTVAFMGYYNWRLTGNALLLPHVLNSRTYRSTGLFLWDHPKAPLEYHNQQFEDFYNGWEREDYNNSWHDVWKVSAEKLTRSGSTYFWWGAVVLLPGLLFPLFDRKMRVPLLTFFLVTAGVFSLIWSMPHYVAPLVCVIFLLLVQAIRYLRIFRPRGCPVGLALSWAAAGLLAADTGVSAGKHRCDPLEWTCQGDPSRAAIAEKLAHTPGKHLIMVRYNEDHNIHDDWVFNGAEIDAAKVLWARELDEDQNAKLFAYFKDRQLWLVTPDDDNTNLIRYQPPARLPDSR
ncbi:MAG TPA: hypothetical protein VFN26_11455 [Candidatus Acidoferrum sp.]|nr:hypothetical protein [Candidatus Acidoferrum sp.]